MKRTPKGGRNRAPVLRLFDSIFPGPSWRAWRALTCTVFGLPMSADEATIFRACTGRQTLPTAPCREVWIIVGRRAGKSRMAAFLSVYIAAFLKFRLAPGERLNVPIVSPSRAQGETVLNYAAAMLEQLPGDLVARRTTEMVDLTNGARVHIQSASFRTPRGFTNGACIDEEMAFMRDESGANPDTEILRMQRPSLATTHGLLVAISSPYAARGELFKTFERHYGRDGSDVLVWRAATRDMNPEVLQATIDQAVAEDPVGAASEYGAAFRADLESLFAREPLHAVVVSGRHELLPVPGIAYTAFVDPSGGSEDSFTLAIAHRNPAGMPVLDVVREVAPPFSPEAVVVDFARELKRYAIATVTGDAYAGEWPREAFRRYGIDYQVSELSRSELFLELLPLVNSNAVELLDHVRLLGQFASLERSVGKRGKDAVDHRKGMHDDVANAAAGALVHVTRSSALATLPTNFDRCNRALSMNFAASSCVVLGGPTIPPFDQICRECPGLAYVRTARDAHTARTGEAIDIRTYVREHIDLEANPFAARVRQSAWLAKDHGL